MISISDQLKMNLAKKYKKPQNLLQSDAKKAIPSKCYSCSHFEQGPNLPLFGHLSWCVSRGFDKVSKRLYTDYTNIDFVETCRGPFFPQKGL